MARPGSYARAKAREQRRSFIRTQWRSITLLSLGYAAVGTVVVIAGAWRHPFLRSYLVGGAVVGYGWFINWFLVSTDGTHGTRMGAMAEEWTAREFAKLRASGWHLINGVTFDRFDVDHVAVGPAGVLAIETKWTSFAWRLTPRGLRASGQPIAQARRGSEKIMLLLKSEGVEVPVVAEVAVWGPGTKELPTDSKVLDGVVLLSGKHANRWRTELGASHLDERTVEAARDVLQEYVDRRERYEASK